MIGNMWAMTEYRPMVEGELWRPPRFYNLTAYDSLPECIKAAYTPEQYAWLSDRDKETLVQRETEPEDE